MKKLMVFMVIACFLWVGLPKNTKEKVMNYSLALLIVAVESIPSKKGYISSKEACEKKNWYYVEGGRFDAYCFFSEKEADEAYANY